MGQAFSQAPFWALPAPVPWGWPRGHGRGEVSPHSSGITASDLRSQCPFSVGIWSVCPSWGLSVDGGLPVPSPGWWGQRSRWAHTGGVSELLLPRWEAVPAPRTPPASADELLSGLPWMWLEFKPTCGHPSGAVPASWSLLPSSPISAGPGPAARAHFHLPRLPLYQLWRC